MNDLASKRILVVSASFCFRHVELLFGSDRTADFTLTEIGRLLLVDCVQIKLEVEQTRELSPLRTV